MKKLWGLLGVLCIGLLVCQKPVETGTINVNSTPTGADVFLDDSTTGKKTNCMLDDVPLGRHKVRLVLEGYKTWEREIELTEDEPDYEISAVLTEPSYTGAIQITSDPQGASIWLDGDSTGYTTDTLMEDIEVGDHILLLTLEEYEDWQDTVTVLEDDTVIVNATLVFAGELDKVTGLTAQATADGAGIHLTWDPVANAETYNVYFNDELLLDGITVTEYTHAYPEMTGIYTVSASADTLEGPESDPLSTEPVVSQTLTVYELNGEGASGVGWDRITGVTYVCLMIDDNYKDSVDCYITDWYTGISDYYYIASPDELGYDEGNTWLDPTAGWRLTGITDPLSMSFEEVSIVPDYGYYTWTDAIEDETYAVRSEDNYYALIEVQSINTSTGEVTIRAAFQPIQGSRLF